MDVLRTNPNKPKDVGNKVKMYDFKRPDKFSKDQMRTLQMMHENYARVCTTSISAALLAISNLRVASVDQLTYEEFTRSLPNPGMIAIVNMDPLRGSAIIEIDPLVVFAMLDRLCGGKCEAPGANDRELTDIELSLTERLIIRLMGNLRESWAQIIDLKPRLGSIETNPQFAQMVHPNDMIVLVTLEMNVNGVKGMMNLCFPYITIEPIIHKLSAQYWYASIRRKNDAGTPASILNSMKADAFVTVDTDAAPLAVLGKLGRGTLLKVSGYEHGNARLTVGGVDVLSLKRDDTERSGLAFSVVEHAVNMPGLFAEKQDTAADMRSSLEPIIRPLAEEIQRTAQDTKKRLDEFSERQRELAERFASKEGTNGNGISTTMALPFGFIRDAEHAANFLKGERPQTIAMILTYLEKDIAAEILGKFDQQLQIDVASRIATLERINPDVIKDTEHVLERKFATLAAEESAPRGGLNCVVDILNIANRNVERTVIEGLEKADPSLAEDLKKRMFVFEDVVILDERTIKALIARIDRKDLSLALKAVSKNVEAHFEKCMPPQEWAAILKTQEDIGHVRLSTVEESQQRIVNIIRMMHESGEIIVPRADEKVV